MVEKINKRAKQCIDGNENTEQQSKTNKTKNNKSEWVCENTNRSVDFNTMLKKYSGNGNLQMLV